MSSLSIAKLNTQNGTDKAALLESRDAPPFEVYLNSCGDNAPADLITDIYLPISPVRCVCVTVRQTYN